MARGKREWLSLVERGPVRPLDAAVGSVAALGAATGAVFALRGLGAPVLSLGVVYLVAVLATAALWRLPYALAVAVASMLAFNWLFLPPVHTFHLAQSENWIALAVYLCTAFLVSALAERASRRAEEAERRRHEALVAADVAALLLESRAVASSLDAIAARVAELLGAPLVRVTLTEEAGTPLLAGDQRVGTLVVVPGRTELPNTVGRVAALLGPLLGTALERERFARDDAAKTALLRSVSHDLRSPLTAIQSTAALLERPETRPEDAADLLASLRTEARRLDRLVGNLLELSRLEAGAAEPAQELWPVDGLVARALDTLGAANARVDVVLPEEVPAVRVDPAQLEHALVNLLENALAYSPGDARVVLAVEVDDGEAVLRVRDRGPGIPAAERERIFEPFHRGSASRPGGSGLGLAIARGFVALNGGRLDVEDAPGGAVFAIGLPVADVPLAVRA